MNDSGVYQLRLSIKDDLDLQVGALGIVHLPAGEYFYTGRATGNLSQRLARHRQPDKSPHWHIDYLTIHPKINISAFKIMSSDPSTECQWNQTLLRQNNANVPVPGFGAGDCQNGCPAHLIFISEKPVENVQ